MSIRIRAYETKDAEKLIDLFRLNTPAYFAEEEEGDLKHYLEEERELYFIVEKEGQIVGSGGINFSDDKQTGIISWDMIHPDFHGQGLGTILLQHRLDYLKNMVDIQEIIVRTSQHTFRFYEKNGFQVKEIKPDYWADGFDLYDMVYVLN